MMTNPFTKPETEVSKPGETAVAQPEAGAMGKASQALSSPTESRLLAGLTTGNDGAMSKFPGGDTLLAQLGGAEAKDAPPKGPTFPLKEPYDAEKDYKGADGKPNARGVELQREARELVDKAAKPDGSLSLRDHGKILDTIAKQTGLSEADKWYLFLQFCKEESKGRDSDGKLIPGTTAHRVLFDTEKPTGLPESGKGDVVRHIIINPTNDSYHGGLVYGDTSWRAGYQRGEDGINFHERVEKPIVNFFRGQGFGADAGDEQASYRQLAALRAMQNGGFNAYSRAWNDNFAK